MKKLFAVATLMFALVSTAFAASPVGKWTTIDDKTKKPRSIVQITENNGVVSGRILRVFKQSGDTGICSKCPGRFKNKKIQGLTFMWGLKQNKPNSWRDGQILDPKNGKIYRCKIKLSKDGNTLKVRGYIGISLLGRTQTWKRRH